MPEFLVRLSQRVIPPKEGIRGPADRGKLWVTALEGSAA